MAIRTEFDQNGVYEIIDTTTGETRRFADQPSWLYHSLIELLKGAERIEEGLGRLQALYNRSALTEAQP